MFGKGQELLGSLQDGQEYMKGVSPPAPGHYGKESCLVLHQVGECRGMKAKLLVNIEIS